MKINRIDHIGIIVNDLEAAVDFFLDFGLEVQGNGEMQMEGELLDRLLALEGARTSFVLMRPPGGEASIELIKFHSPPEQGDTRPLPVTALGLRHIAFEVEDLEGLVAKLAARGAEVFGEIQTYGTSYKLCYVRGPEGLILDLAERIK